MTTTLASAGATLAAVCAADRSAQHNAMRLGQSLHLKIARNHQRTIVSTGERDLALAVVADRLESYQLFREYTTQRAERAS